MSMQYATRYNEGDNDDDSEFEYQDNTMNILEFNGFNDDDDDDEDDDNDNDDNVGRVTTVSKPFRKLQFTEAVDTFVSKPLQFVASGEGDSEKEKNMRSNDVYQDQTLGRDQEAEPLYAQAQQQGQVEVHPTRSEEEEEEEEEEDEDENETLFSLMQRQITKTSARKPVTKQKQKQKQPLKQKQKQKQKQKHVVTLPNNRKLKQSTNNQSAVTSKKKSSADENVITIDSDSSHPSPSKPLPDAWKRSNFHYSKIYPRSTVLAHYSPPRDAGSPRPNQNQNQNQYQQEHRYLQQQRTNVNDSKLTPSPPTAGNKRTRNNSHPNPFNEPRDNDDASATAPPPLEDYELAQLQHVGMDQFDRILSLDKEAVDFDNEIRSQTINEDPSPPKQRRVNNRPRPTSSSAAPAATSNRNAHSRNNKPAHRQRMPKSAPIRSVPPPPSSVQMPTHAPQPIPMPPPQPMFNHPHQAQHPHPTAFPIPPMFYPGPAAPGMLSFPPGYAMPPPPPPFHSHPHPMQMGMPPHPFAQQHQQQTQQQTQHARQLHKTVPPERQAATLYRAASVVTPGGSGPVSMDNAWPSFADQTAPDPAVSSPIHRNRRSNSSTPPSAKSREHKRSPRRHSHSARHRSANKTASPRLNGVSSKSNAKLGTVSPKPDATHGLRDPPTSPLQLAPSAAHTELLHKLAEDQGKSIAKVDTLPKSSAAGKSTKDTVDSADTSDAEPGADYISLITQKNCKATEIAGIKWAFEQVSGPSLRWKCILTGKLVPFKEGDELLERSGIGRTKSIAKHKAAKPFCEALNAIVKNRSTAKHNPTDKCANNDAVKHKESSNEADADNDKDKAGESNDSNDDVELNGAKAEHIRNAVNIITALWQSGRTENNPNYDFEMCGERWKCSLTLKVCDVPDSIKCTAVAQSKKGAKHTVSYKTFLKLRELKVPGIEVYEQFQSKANVVQDATNKLRPADESHSVNDAAAAVSSKDIVLNSDDELAEKKGLVASCGNRAGTAADENDDHVLDRAKKSDCLSLPDGFQVSVARTEPDVDAWMSEHVRCPGRVGVYIDSQVARAAVRNDATRIIADLETGGMDGRVVSAERIEWPTICVSTDAAAILLSNKWRADTDKYPRDDKDTIHADKGAFEFWVPDSLLDVLESRQVVKNGCLYSVGLNCIQDQLDAALVNFNDVSCISVALTGVANVDGALYDTSLASLAEMWLHKRWPDVNKKSDFSVGDGGGAELASGPDNFETQTIVDSIFSAFLCLVLTSAWKAEEKRRRLNLRGPSVEFTDGASKFLQDPK